MARVRLTIRGLVQGVFFRQSAADVAARLGVAGVARNRPDGSVEIVAEGPDQALERLRSWCAHGPRGAVVELVEVVDEAATGEFSDFRISS